MIHIACNDKNSDLSTEFEYLTRAFGLSAGQFVDAPPGNSPIVLIQPQDGVNVQGDVSIVDFVHPDECTYLFGDTDGNLDPGSMVFSARVYIPHTPTWNMFAAQAAAIVLYDRYIKRGTFG